MFKNFCSYVKYLQTLNPIGSSTQLDCQFSTNPIVVDEEGSEGELAVSDGVELEVEENEVAIPVPPPGCLVLIEDMV